MSGNDDGNLEERPSRGVPEKSNSDISTETTSHPDGSTRKASYTDISTGKDSHPDVSTGTASQPDFDSPETSVSHTYPEYDLKPAVRRRELAKKNGYPEAKPLKPQPINAENALFVLLGVGLTVGLLLSAILGL